MITRHAIDRELVCKSISKRRDGIERWDQKRVDSMVYAICHVANVYIKTGRREPIDTEDTQWLPCMAPPRTPKHGRQLRYHRPYITEVKRRGCPTRFFLSYLGERGASGPFKTVEEATNWYLGGGR